ncbi:MAG: phage tail protein [Ilumatobacteraceae bacterium]
MTGRGTIPGLQSPVPIAGLLPGIYHDDEFTRQFTGGMDDVLAPVFATLDCLDAYVDPWLTPEDFLEWLAGWVGVVIDEGWPLDRSRAVIANIAELYRWRGTVRGLTAELAIYTGGQVEIAESGGAAWSLTPGAELPGADEPRLAVRISVEDPSSVDERTVDRMVAAAKPAHVVHIVEIATRRHHERDGRS